MLAHHNDAIGPIPGGWPYEAIWQNSNKSAYGGDSDIFNGSLDGLHKLALG